MGDAEGLLCLGGPLRILIGFSPFSLILFNPEGNRGRRRKEIKFWIERLIINLAEELVFTLALHSQPLFSSICFSVSSHGLIMTRVTGQGPTLIQYDLILTITSAKTLFPNKVMF